YIADIITGDVMNSGITAAKVTKYDTYEITKADKATTLEGYGITDAYTKTELYTKSETDGKLAVKADKATTLAGYGITDGAKATDIITGFTTTGGAVKAIKADSSTIDVAQLQDAAISGGSITTGGDGTKYLTLKKTDRYTGITTELAGIDLTGITSSITIGGTTAPLINGDNIEFKKTYDTDGTTVKEIAIGLQKDITLRSIKLNTGTDYIWLDEDGISISDKKTGSTNFSGMNETAIYTGKSEISDDGDIISSEIYSGLSQDTLMVGKKNYITADGINANNQEIANLSAAAITENGNYAATTGQLYSEQQARIAGDTLFSSGNYYAPGVSTTYAISSLDAQIKLNENAIQTNKSSINLLQTTKADKATTLAGYGIEDAYTKQEINNALGQKADASRLAELAEQTAVSERKITVLENTAQEHTEKINTLTADMAQAQSDIAALETSAATKADKAYVDDALDTIKAQTTAKDGFYIKRANSVADNLEALDLAINSQEQPSAASAYETGEANATAAGKGASALGRKAEASGDKSVAIGYSAKATGNETISIGNANVVNGNRSGAIGDPSVINGEGSYSIGNDNYIDGNNTFVLGSGAGSADNPIKANNSVILGNGSTATEDNVVSVGSADNQRRIVNVADGRYATDAVNMRQLEAVSGEVREVGAISAALAGLHYVEPSGEGDDKLVGAVAYGGYRGANAEAIGIAYKPNPNMMFTASTSISNGNDSQNAYNAGFSIKFGKGETAKTRAELQKQVKFVNEENKALKTQIVNLSAETAGQTEEIRAQNEKIMRLESDKTAQDEIIRKLLERVEKLENGNVKSVSVAMKKQAKAEQTRRETKASALQKPVSGNNIQVLSSTRRSDSQRLADKLCSIGYNAFVGEGVVKGRTYYRVFVDGGDNPQATLAKLKKAGINGFIFK
ncbi:MAG: YadA-like family protein, partial [Synergistaceae bacterium]|nr:YadA-like family protein [Synergistaceae bacterium]